MGKGEQARPHDSNRRNTSGRGQWISSYTERRTADSKDDCSETEHAVVVLLLCVLNPVPVGVGTESSSGKYVQRANADPREYILIDI